MNMISSDKLVPVGINTLVGCALYVAGAATPATLVGMAASTLFQAYYPDSLDQIKAKCGETGAKALTWIYPSVVFLGGALGGLPYKINLYTTAIFATAQFVGTMITKFSGDNRCDAEVTALCNAAKASIKKGAVEDANKFLDKARALFLKREGLHGLGMLRSSVSSTTTILETILALIGEGYKESSKKLVPIEKLVQQAAIYVNQLEEMPDPLTLEKNDGRTLNFKGTPWTTHSYVIHYLVSTAAHHLKDFKLSEQLIKDARLAGRF